MHAMSRRKFLTHSAGVAVTLTTTGVLSRSAWADPLGLPIGIQLYTVGADMQKDAKDAIRNIGGNRIQRGGDGGLWLSSTAAELCKVKMIMGSNVQALICSST